MERADHPRVSLQRRPQHRFGLASAGLAASVALHMLLFVAARMAGGVDIVYRYQ